LLSILKESLNMHRFTCVNRNWCASKFNFARVNFNLHACSFTYSSSLYRHITKKIFFSDILNVTIHTPEQHEIMRKEHCFVTLMKY